MRTSLGIWTVFTSVLLAIAGCGGGNGGGGSDAGGGADTGVDDAPFELTKSSLGVMFQHGSAGFLTTQGQEGEAAAERVRSAMHTGFLDLQIYDEHAPLRFGEWEVQKHPDSDGPDYRGPSEFSQNPTLGRFRARADDLSAEVEAAFGAFGGEGFAKKGILLDFWRMREDWYVRWDGKLENEENLKGEGNWGFFREEFTSDVKLQIKDVVGKHKPAYFVVGRDMERLLARKGKPGVAPDEFLNFRQFYRDVASRVGQVSPNTKVGVGFHWDHFVRYVAPSYGEGTKGEIPPTETLARAFESVILPFAQTGGLLALKSYRTAEGDASYYRFLASIDDRYDMEDVSLVWYSVGSPVESTTSYRKQRTFLEAFIEWNRGVSPDLVVWRALLNYNGADTGDQTIDGRCQKLVEDENFQLEKSHCYDGLITNNVTRDKEVFTFIQEQIGGG